MIKIENLSFSYPDNTFSISIDNLTIGKGESIAIKGPSGSGKSTFLKLISGQAKSHKGKISIENTNLSDLSEESLRKLRLENFGIISQSPNLIEWLSVKDNIYLPLSFLNSKENLSDRYENLLNKFSLKELENKTAKNLSFGEQFRVSIIRALLAKPNYILADEPTASFDAKLRDKAIEILLEESKNIGATLILVSHEEEVLKSFSSILSSESCEVKV